MVSLRCAVMGFVLSLVVSGWQTAGAQQTGSTDARFDVFEFRVEGNTVLERTEIESVLTRHLGAQRSVADVEAARSALEELYRSRGYGTVLVDIPEQEVNEAVVVLRVSEGRVARFSVTGAKYFSPRAVQAAVPSLAPGSVPLLAQVQQELNAVNGRTADRAVTPVLRPGKTPGTLDVELQLHDSLPLHGSIEVNNYHPQNTSDWRVSAALRYDNLWQRQHSLSVQYQTAPEESREQQVWAATYLARFEASKALLVGYGVTTESDTTTVGNLNVIGAGDILGLRLILPIDSDPGLFHSATLGFDYKDFSEDLAGTGADSAQSTPIDYGLLSLGYAATRMRGDQDTKSAIDLSWNLGLRAFDDTLSCARLGDTNRDGVPEVLTEAASEFECKRHGARANFSYLRADVSHQQALGAWRAALRGRAQWSHEPLINNEQYSLGGANTVRGYFESQTLGDSALLLDVEASTPFLGKGLGSGINDLRLIAFFDWGHVQLEQAGAGEPASTTLAASGAGLRLRALKGFSLTADWAYPLREAGTVKRGDSRTHLSLSYEF